MDNKSLREKIIALNNSGRLQESMESKAMLKRMNVVKKKIESAGVNTYKLPNKCPYSFVKDSGL